MPFWFASTAAALVMSVPASDGPSSGSGAGSGGGASDDSLYPIAVLIDELRNEDVQVSSFDNTSILKRHILFVSFS